MSKKFKIIVCASGGGGNFQALIDSRLALDIEINLLIVDRQCGAIDRAISSNIPHVIINRTGLGDQFSAHLDRRIPEDTDLVVLAGFMSIISEFLCEKWKGKMINTHPSLLPKYGGRGMYGVKVQEAVMQEREEFAGCTVHYVSSDVDAGAIILQKKVLVDYGETPWQLGGRVFNEENKLLVDAVRLIKSTIK